MKQRYKITKYEYEVDYVAADSTLVFTDEYQGDLRDALHALDSQCWDDVDQQSETVICYPADWHTDPRTGVVTHTDVAIEADNERNLERLMNIWEGGETDDDTD